MNSTNRITRMLLLLTIFTSGCAERGVPFDEARARRAKEPFATPADQERLARESFPPATGNYFKDMDGVPGEQPGTIRPLDLDAEEIKGRNAWVLWAGGNEAFWDWLARHSYGSIDLLKLVDSVERGKRFAKVGLITDPGSDAPTAEETEQAYGIRFDRPKDPARRFKLDYQKQYSLYHDYEPDPEVYGYPSGVVGLRLFWNPEFVGQARTRWNSDLYYADTPEGRAYASRPDTIRPFRVGMSCGFCHIAPHPLNPPANPEFPEWANLSNNIGNQYMRFRSVFANTLRPDNFLYYVLDAQLPGTIDTSLVAADNLNNPNTVNSFYGLRARLARGEHNPRETIGPDTLGYLRTYVHSDFSNPHRVPRVLLDGSDSVGVELALARVYLNIGTHHQQWVRLHNTLLGFRKQAPFKLKDVAANSLYWHATRIRVGPLMKFFLKSTDPMRLKDAPLTAEQRKQHLKGDGTSAHPDYALGRQVFAKGCIACHSSIQPGDDPEIEAAIRPGKDETLPQPDGFPMHSDKLTQEQKVSLARSRQTLRLRPEDLARLTRGAGALPAAYQQWARKAVDAPGFWDKDRNYLSTDARIPVTLTHTNSARAMATNAIHGNIWEDFTSQTYKELDSVGRVGYHDPFSGAEKSFQAPAGGPGYYRVPTLMSIWATAPFFHNNALGTFNNDPSVAGRLAAFDDASTRLLWPEKRREPTKHVYWNRNKPRWETLDNASPEQLEQDGGWIWRTAEESHIMTYGHHIPTLIAGFTGWSAFWVVLVPWLPSIALVLLGTALLLSGPLISLTERLERHIPWLDWLLMPIHWIIAAGAFVLAVVASYYIWWEFWPLIQVLDVSTRGAILFLRLQASLLPIVLFVSVGVLFSLHNLPAGGLRRQLTQGLGALCFVFAVLTALSFGRFLSGRGPEVTFGPIPKGVPVNVLANMDPDTSLEMRDKRQVARAALIEFVLAYHRAEEGKKPGLQEFEQQVAPALMNASKCPDFVMDRGHDYEFMRQLSDAEKRALIELLKTF